MLGDNEQEQEAPPGRIGVAQAVAMSSLVVGVASDASSLGAAAESNGTLKVLFCP